MKSKTSNLSIHANMANFLKPDHYMILTSQYTRYRKVLEVFKTELSHTTVIYNVVHIYCIIICLWDRFYINSNITIMLTDFIIIIHMY